MVDNVNHPAHYETNGIECIDAMVASQGAECVMDYCLCNAFKYIWRCQHKGKQTEDIQKAIWYLNEWLSLGNKGNREIEEEISKGFFEASGIEPRSVDFVSDQQITFCFIQGGASWIKQIDPKDYEGMSPYEIGKAVGKSVLDGD